MTHYDTLGVSQNATIGEIKRAYRWKAMKYHPDKGGTEEEFKPIARAYEILTDPDKRKRYDETGDDSDSKMDEEVVTTIAGVVHEILLSLVERGCDPEKYDLLKLVDKKLSHCMSEFEEQIRGNTKRADKLRKVAERFEVNEKDTHNLLFDVVMAPVKALDVQIAFVTHQLEVITAAKTIINKHTYKFDKDPNNKQADPGVFQMGMHIIRVQPLNRASFE